MLARQAPPTHGCERRPLPSDPKSAVISINCDGKMLKFVLLVNKQGQTRLSQYYEYVPVEERVTTEADIVRKCLARSEESVRAHEIHD